MTNLRDKLDIDYIVMALLQKHSYGEIASRETARLRPFNITVSRSAVAGVVRDLKNGKLRPSYQQSSAYPTYIYGTEPNNGGIPIFKGEFDIEADRVLVVNDVHFPFTRYDLLAHIPAVIKKYDIDTVIIAGDLLDANRQAVFRNLVPPVSLEFEMREAEKFCNMLAALVSNIYYFRGNHEDRITLNLDGDLGFGEFASIFAYNAEVSPYDRMFVTSGGARWLIAHQRNASPTPGAVGTKLAYKYLSNVIVTHQHSTSITPDIYNHFIIMDVGGLVDPDKLAYYQLKTGTGRVPTPAFATIIDGRGELWTDNPLLTDWGRIYD